MRIIGHLCILTDIIYSTLQSIRLQIYRMAVHSSLIIPTIVQSIRQTELRLLIIISEECITVIESFPKSLSCINTTYITDISFLYYIIDNNGKTCITIAHSRIIYILNTGNIIRLQSQDILYRSLYIIDANLNATKITADTLLSLIYLEVRQMQFSQKIIAIRGVFLNLGIRQDNISVNLMNHTSRLDHNFIQVQCSINRSNLFFYIYRVFFLSQTWYDE